MTLREISICKTCVIYDYKKTDMHMHNVIKLTLDSGDKKNQRGCWNSSFILFFYVIYTSKRRIKIRLNLTCKIQSFMLPYRGNL